MRVGLLSFKETFPSSIQRDLWILFGAVGLLLLIACANVSNLLLSRAAGRQREMAVRAALGGSRSRLLRQLLTESLILSLAGGLLGVGLAFVALRVILLLVPPGTIPDESEISLNLPVLLFTLAVSIATSVIFGLAPALYASRDLAQPLRSSGRGFSAGRRQALLRKSLVVTGVAMSIVLLVGASLMIRTAVALGTVDVGVEPGRILTMRVPLPETEVRGPVSSRSVLRRRDAVDCRRARGDVSQRSTPARTPSATSAGRCRFPAPRRPPSQSCCTRSAPTTCGRWASRSSPVGC